MTTSQQQLFFQFGREPQLSLMEILAVFEAQHISFRVLEVTRTGVLVHVDCIDDFSALQDRLGGTIRIVEIFDQLQGQGVTSEQLLTLFSSCLPPEGKIQLGISLIPFLGQQNALSQYRRLEMPLKSALREQGRSIRIIRPTGGQQILSTASVLGNHILTKGLEIVFLSDNKDVFVGCTRSIQDINAYSKRDEGRPVRDLSIGMMPLKLSQILLNLSGAVPDARILDPFVGMGTILQEGLRLGCRVVGSDISSRMVVASKKNLQWFCSEFTPHSCEYEILQSDALRLRSVVKGPFQAIVTEGTLGPLFGSSPSDSQIRENFEKLGTLYSDVFRQFYDLLAFKGRIVLTFPAYFKQNSDSPLLVPFLDSVLKMGYSMHTFDDSCVRLGLLTSRGTAVYRRPGQFVGREVVVLLKV